MAFVHEDSCQCANSELDLFSLPPTQTSILKSRSIEYSPISILGNGQVEFAVFGSGENYTDLANTYLHVICKVLHSDGSKLKEDENIAPVNNLLHSMWVESSGPLSERYAHNPVHQHLSVQGLLGNAALL